MPFLYSLSNPNYSLFFLIFVRLTITFVSFPLRSFSVTSTTSWLALILPLLAPQDKDSHLEFITCAANLRAENYDISPAKRIVGQIVPAIVTTTAAVAGLTCLELYKLVWQHKDLGSYRHTSLQLSDVFLSRAQCCETHSIQCHLVPSAWAPEVSCLPSPDVRGAGKAA
uniref:Ubiquitin-activating enzyme SCCH domain-containing protein n=1 Tax=Naja naja TaxID=35670 RepID=A0A8C6XZN2_NAJNA